MIESLDCWESIPELVEIHRLLNSWYRLLSLQSFTNLRDVTMCVKRIRREGVNNVENLARGMYRVKQIAGDRYDDNFLDSWLDKFLLSRIGTSMLLDQHVQFTAKEHGGRGKPTGIIDPRCDTTGICKEIAASVTELCQEQTGHAPPYTVETYKDGDRSPQQDSAAAFSYIPGYLRYIMTELLKNSFHATVMNSVDAADIERRAVLCLSVPTSHG